MKYLITRPISSAVVMFGGIYTALWIWMNYRPEIQSALRAAQDLLFWWV
jgi:hypothetical protein